MLERSSNIPSPPQRVNLMDDTKHRPLMDAKDQSDMLGLLGGEKGANRHLKLSLTPAP